MLSVVLCTVLQVRLVHCLGQLQHWACSMVLYSLAAIAAMARVVNKVWVLFWHGGLRGFFGGELTQGAFLGAWRVLAFDLTVRGRPMRPTRAFSTSRPLLGQVAWISSTGLFWFVEGGLYLISASTGFPWGCGRASQASRVVAFFHRLWCEVWKLGGVGDLIVGCFHRLAS